MMIGKRSTSFSTIVLPQTTMGTLISRPMTTRSKLPLAAPATPSTLSTPISASAITIVRMAPQNVVAWRLVAIRSVAFRRGEQLVGDPDQAEATDEHQAGDLEQPDHAQRQRRSHGDGTDGAPDDGAALKVAGESAGGQRDDDGVVTGEDEVDQDDRQQRRQPSGGEEFHAGSMNVARQTVHVARSAGSIVGHSGQTASSPPLCAACIEGLARHGVICCRPTDRKLRFVMTAC